MTLRLWLFAHAPCRVVLDTAESECLMSWIDAAISGTAAGLWLMAVSPFFNVGCYHLNLSAYTLEQLQFAEVLAKPTCKPAQK